MLDAHCHMDQFPDPISVAQDCEREGVVTVAVTNLPTHYLAGLGPAKQFRHVKLALGLHPLVVAKHSDALHCFLRVLPTVSFVGEIGLDFSKEGIASKTEQIMVFETIASALSGAHRFITLHSRKAEDTVLSILSTHNVENAVFHWFSGTLSVLVKAIDRGYYFSVNPAMVSSANGRRITDHIPHDRLLTETDAPYVKIGNRPTRPTDVSIVLEYLAEKWRMPAEDVAASVLDNFHRITVDTPSPESI